MASLLNSIRTLPRAVLWAIVAAVAVALYFLALEPLMSRTNLYASEADRLESDLRRAADLGSTDTDDGRLLSTGLKAFGKPNLPSDPESRPQTIHRVIDEVLDDHDINQRTKTERSSTLSGGYADLMTQGEGRIERYIVEISFEAEQETVAAIVADIEQSPGVSAISRVKIDRAAAYGPYSSRDQGENRTVRATIAAETWVRVRSGAFREETSGDDEF